MHRELLLKAFEKARRELVQEGYSEPSDSKCANRISEIVSEVFPYGEKSFRKLYKKAITNPQADIQIPRPEVLTALAHYLGYEDYRTFVVRNSKDEGMTTIADRKVSKKTNQLLFIAIALFFATIIGFFGYHYFNKQRWMEWEGTHYVEVSFDAEKLKHGTLKAYKEERITDFEKVTPNCETRFFNEDGSVRIWYGKNKDGNLEYYTSYGLHPLTEKTLKPITRYMIGKYICGNGNF
ncbi:hypothetical protein POV26_12115 [Aequorivita todarodis]|uniref:hypothetical protein n=1 Tax=Aequorivita todarodis TaxID=2036821 RepID=UPI0023503B13|nr:hypothetical protein [Aequorivita todarodis]MDC8001784.1 hypothetical protein [Aequorivita todarodis]